MGGRGVMEGGRVRVLCDFLCSFFPGFAWYLYLLSSDDNDHISKENGLL